MSQPSIPFAVKRRGGEPAAKRTKTDNRQPQNPSSPPLSDKALLVSILDIVEANNGREFHIWALDHIGRRALLRVTDFAPYLYLTAPCAGGEGEGGLFPAPLPPERLAVLQASWNRLLPTESYITSLTNVAKRPIVYYRPHALHPTPMLKVTFQPGASTRRAAVNILKVLHTPSLASAGFRWITDCAVYEHEVSLVQRFLVDTGCAGGSWVFCPTESRVGARDGFALAATTHSCCALEGTIPWRALVALSKDATQLSDTEWTPQMPPQVADAWEVVQAGHGDPTQIWALWQHGLQVAARGDMPMLRVLCMDVATATHDGVQRTPVPSGDDPIVAIGCSIHSVEQQQTPAAQQTPPAEKTPHHVVEEQQHKAGAVHARTTNNNNISNDPPTNDQQDSSTLSNDDDDDDDDDVIVLGDNIDDQPLPHAPPTSAPHHVVFLLTSHPQPTTTKTPHTTTHHFSSEANMLRAWLHYVHQQDPDCFLVYQVEHSLGALQARFSVLKIEGGGLRLGRMMGPGAPVLNLKRITMYSAAWVKSQSRMASTSNQETFRADLDGRLVFDVLRQVLTATNLASYTLEACCAALLKRPLEKLPADVLPEVLQVPGWVHHGGGGHTTTQTAAHGGRRTIHTPTNTPHTPPPPPAAAGIERVVCYMHQRITTITQLATKLATLPETVEMARAVGLNMSQVLYNAQMIRTWSLLLRTARQWGYTVGGRTNPEPLLESPYLLHPVEHKTSGHYSTPIVVLDFASLYPSVFRAYNLCYTTLLHKSDKEHLSPDDYITTPSGDSFVKPHIRPGILPSVLAALIQARATTRTLLKHEPDPTRRAVLDSRQKAIKLVANALYGFTGAGASPLQCVPLADSCLSLGAACCRRAHQMVTQLAEEGALGGPAAGCRVIYAQTDSLFVNCPAATPAQAVAIGRDIATRVNAVFPPEIQLKYEYVAQPFLLMQVNRYAGRAFETDHDAVNMRGKFVVKGLTSTWRQAAPVVSYILGGALQRIIMQQDVQGAVDFVQHHVAMLLSGVLEPWHCTMTGGLWRVTGEQVAAAAAADDESSPTPPSTSNAPPPTEEVKGPHGALAVRLAQRDPGRTFVLGERVPYVLLQGSVKQEDAAEDPLTAVKHSLSVNHELMWTNKLRKPLSELMGYVLSPQQLKNLLHGNHTLVRPRADFMPRAADHAPLPSPDKGRGRQRGLGAFFTVTAKCLGCKCSLQHKGKGPAPPLCATCAKDPSIWQSVVMDVEGAASEQQRRHTEAFSFCRLCHSGGLMGDVLCENAECPALYARLGSAARLAAISTVRARLDAFDGGG